MKKRSWTRIFAGLLAAVLLQGTLGVSALAADEDAENYQVTVTQIDPNTVQTDETWSDAAQGTTGSETTVTTTQTDAQDRPVSTEIAVTGTESTVAQTKDESSSTADKTITVTVDEYIASLKPDTTGFTQNDDGSFTNSSTGANGEAVTTVVKPVTTEEGKTIGYTTTTQTVKVEVTEGTGLTRPANGSQTNADGSVSTSVVSDLTDDQGKVIGFVVDVTQRAADGRVISTSKQTVSGAARPS